MVNYAISVCKNILPVSTLQCVPDVKDLTTEVFALSTLGAKTVNHAMEETGRQVQEDLEGEDLQLMAPHMDPTSRGLHMYPTSTCPHLTDLKGHQFQGHLRDPPPGHNKVVIYQYQVLNHKTWVLICPVGQIHSRSQLLVLLLLQPTQVVLPLFYKQRECMLKLHKVGHKLLFYLTLDLIEVIVIEIW